MMMVIFIITNIKIITMQFSFANYNLPVKVGYTRKGAIIYTTTQSVSRE